MISPDFNELDQKIAYLISLCHRLKEQNRQLRVREKQLQAEQQQLIERNAIARTRVETMISSLKALEQE